jgi:phage protein U
MMAILGNFIFTISPKSPYAVEYNAININENYEFVEHKKINDFSTFVDVSKHSRTFKLTGEITMKKMYILKGLIELARSKEPVIFATGSGNMAVVVIKSIQRVESLFDKHGGFSHQSFDVDLQEVDYSYFYNIMRNGLAMIKAQL